VVCKFTGGAGHIMKDCKQKRPGMGGIEGSNNQAKIDEEYLSLMAELGEVPPEALQQQQQQQQQQKPPEQPVAPPPKPYSIFDNPRNQFDNNRNQTPRAPLHAPPPSQPPPPWQQ
jgi:splicing factor 1